MTDPDYKILYEKLAKKVKAMRAWQKQKDQRIRFGSMLARDDHKRMRQLENEVDNILLLDTEGMVVFQKNKNT